MGNRRPSPEHQAAVSRRLAQLGAELDGVRGRSLDDPTAVPGAPPAPERRAPEPREAVGPAPLVPQPGRHAARRPGRSVADALPPTLRGRVALGPTQLALVAGLVAAGLAVTCWWVVRGDAREVVTPTLSSPTADLATPADPVAATSAPVDEPSGQVTVDVTGKVRRPGIAVLDAGARVIDALEAAGGARPGVDLGSLNLARVLVDGEQIVVGVAAGAGVAGAATPIPPGSTTGALVNLNTADQALLETLPDVGPVTAEAIIA
ncbi:MAG TPA: SLBB domain-containing protein, partial [Nocardioides sp.]|nr:SLBB domain-containing protein [Nocardioides sp.]